MDVRERLEKKGRMKKVVYINKQSMGRSRLGILSFVLSCDVWFYDVAGFVGGRFCLYVLLELRGLFFCVLFFCDFDLFGF